MGETKIITCLIIDCQSLAYKFVFEMTNLSSGKNKTNVIYGFLKKILSLAETYGTSSFVFCWDSRQSYRRMDFPEMRYKNRPPDPTKIKIIEAAREQFALLRKDVLPSMGFKNVFMQTGYEADDLIAHIVLHFLNEYIIVTGDQDIYQVLSDNTRIHDVRLDKLFTINDFHLQFKGLSPEQWVDVKSLAGCSSDTVPGVAGVGEKSAVNWLMGMLKKGKIRDKIEDPMNHEIIEKCQKLVRLPYQGSRPISISKIEFNPFYSLDFMDCFKKYNCISFVNGFERWRKVFDLYSGRE